MNIHGYKIKAKGMRSMLAKTEVGTPKEKRLTNAIRNCNKKIRALKKAKPTGKRFNRRKK